jgi:hypothetical protein
MGGQLASDLIGRIRQEISARASQNRFVDLLEASRVPRERLTWLAGEQFRIVGSDQRSFALLAARFPQLPAGEMFLSLAQGELHALRLLSDFAAALGWQDRDLRATNRGRVAGALQTRYRLAREAVGFFRFFAEPAPGFTEQATLVVAAGLAAGEDPQEAVRAARALHAYEIGFWDALAEGLGEFGTAARRE